MPHKSRSLPNLKDYRPSEFMRKRRPGYYSDSTVISDPSFSRESFEYHLETLTSRKQEVEFEHFCRRLAQKELCPNLLPQTGPTGGGDSKVDSETYPVSESIATRWYEGIGTEASQHRWAFAFSAKKDWLAKVKSDVKGIVETGRDYKLIYFITNQFVPDKKRSKVEADLKNKWCIEVRILDRSWIIERVFENRRFAIVMETLNIAGKIETRKIGPLDAERESELSELDEQISDENRYIGVEYQLAEDCLQTALLARGLERPRFEVEGRFARAERIAEKVGYLSQKLRVAYSRAWTAFWWWDDLAELNTLYDSVEKFAIDSQQAAHLEKLFNLWMLLKGAVNNALAEDIAKFKSRTEDLIKSLERLATNKQRPTNALEALTYLSLMDLPDALRDPDLLGKVTAKIKDIFIQSEGLVNYPLEPLINIILEFGKAITDSAGFDELFEMVINITAKRKSDLETGLILLERGYQKLNAEKRYEAIRLFGRAQTRLAKEESRPALISSLAGCAIAYESAGLLWAARASLLAASDQAFIDFRTAGKLSNRALACIHHLIWIEIKLGRIPCVLAWVQAFDLVAGHLVLDDHRKKKYNEERNSQDIMLGLLFLKFDLWHLKWLDFLPAVLDELGLMHSWLALLYALGYEDFLRSESIIPETESSEAVKASFGEWRNRPESNYLADEPELLNERFVHLKSYVLGCEIDAEAENDLTSIQLAESILGVLEAFMATSIGGEVLPFRPYFWIKIRHSQVERAIYSIEEFDGERALTVEHPQLLTIRVSREEESTHRSWLLEVCIGIISEIAVIRNPEPYFTALANDEAFQRALDFADISIFIGNILGDCPEFQLSDWQDKPIEKRFPLIRRFPWDEGLEKKVETETGLLSLESGEGDVPEELLNIESLKHQDRKIFSLINNPLWDRAGWSGTLYMYPPDALSSSVPEGFVPGIALGFKDVEAGKLIFNQWHIELGQEDVEEKLRVSIITGINKYHPFSYKVIIGINPNVMLKYKSITHSIFISRINEMVPTSSQNIDIFIKLFKAAGKFILMPGMFSEAGKEVKIFPELAILKKEIRFVSAWQIGEHDVEIMALDLEDEPEIPDHVENPPVYRALQRLKKLRRTNDD